MRLYLWVMTCIAATTLVACGDATQMEEAAAVKVVQLAQVKARHDETEFSFPAKVVPRSTVDLTFRVGGSLQSINLPEGQFVKKGALIAKLDQEPFERAVRMAQVRLKQATLELSRVKAVASKGIGSEKSVDNAQVAYELAEIDLENSKANLQYSQLRAPFDALVATRLIENEGFVKAGSPIARLQDLSRIHFEFDVPERLVSAYRRKQVMHASAYIDGSVAKSFDITYVEHSTEPDPVTQTYQVVYAMDNKQGLDITPGVRATVTLSGNTADVFNVVGVPVNSVVTANDKSLYVWVYDAATQQVNKQLVTVGPVSQGWIAILSGLTEGQQVVAAGASQMQQGQRVRPFVMQ